MILVLFEDMNMDWAESVLFYVVRHSYKIRLDFI